VVATESELKEERRQVFIDSQHSYF